MNEEVFGPILPILPYSDLGKLIMTIKSLPKPLAGYVVSRNQETIDRVLRSVPFGGGAVTLAVPSATMLGQLKTIEMGTDDGDVTLVLTNVVGQSSGTTATCNSAGDTLGLLAAFDTWVVIKEFGIGLA